MTGNPFLRTIWSIPTAEDVALMQLYLVDRGRATEIAAKTAAQKEREFYFSEEGQRLRRAKTQALVVRHHQDLDSALRYRLNAMDTKWRACRATNSLARGKTLKEVAKSFGMTQVNLRWDIGAWRAEMRQYGG